MTSRNQNRHIQAVNSNNEQRATSPGSSRTVNFAPTDAVDPDPAPVVPPNEENDDSDDDDEEELIGFRDSHPGFILFCIFVGYLLVLYLNYLFFPEMEPDERKHLKLPMNLKQAKNLAGVLKHYTGNHYYTVLLSFSLLYLFLQTFAIPGSIFLSIMSGFLFPFWVALFLVCFCSACGASSCYVLSWVIGRPLVRAHLRPTMRHWREKVREERENLLNFIIFLRITPILPNWFINIASPHIGVPLGVFWFGSFVGVAPPSVLAVQAGRTLDMMTNSQDHISWTSIIVLALIAIGSLVPVIWRRWYHS